MTRQHEAEIGSDERLLASSTQELAAIQADIASSRATAVRASAEAQQAIAKSVVLPAQIGPESARATSRAVHQYAGQSGSGLQAVGSPANWRCIAVEKLSRVELLEDAWHSAPSHSRPQTCVSEVDVDAED